MSYPPTLDLVQNWVAVRREKIPRHLSNGYWLTTLRLSIQVTRKAKRRGKHLRSEKKEERVLIFSDEGGWTMKKHG